MKRVLFVCLGNICRSPMAHGVLQHRLHERGLAHLIDVDSCGTSGYHAGDAPDPRTLAVLRRHGVELHHASRQLHPTDAHTFDLILCADASNVRNSLAILGPAAAPKVHKILAPTTGADVPDPYYGGDSGFDDVFDMLGDALDAWIDTLIA